MTKMNTFLQNNKIVNAFLASAIIVVIIMLSASFFVSAQSVTSLPEQEMLDLGNRYLSEGKFEEAILYFEMAIKINPNNIEAQQGIAQAYRAIAQTVQEDNKYFALEVYNNAAQRDGNYEEVINIYESDIEEGLSNDYLIYQRVESILDLTIDDDSLFDYEFYLSLLIEEAISRGDISSLYEIYDLILKIIDRYNVENEEVLTAIPTIEEHIVDRILFTVNGLLGEKNYKQAIILLEESLEKFKGHEDIYVMLSMALSAIEELDSNARLELYRELLEQYTGEDELIVESEILSNLNSMGTETPKTLNVTRYDTYSERYVLYQGKGGTSYGTRTVTTSYQDSTTGHMILIWPGAYLYSQPSTNSVSETIEEPTLMWILGEEFANVQFAEAVVGNQSVGWVNLSDVFIF